MGPERNSDDILGVRKGYSKHRRAVATSYGKSGNIRCLLSEEIISSFLFRRHIRARCLGLFRDTAQRRRRGEIGAVNSIARSKFLQFQSIFSHLVTGLTDALLGRVDHGSEFAFVSLRAVKV